MPAVSLPNSFPLGMTPAATSSPSLSTALTAARSGSGITRTSRPTASPPVTTCTSWRQRCPNSSRLSRSTRALTGPDRSASPPSRVAFRPRPLPPAREGLRVGAGVRQVSRLRGLGAALRLRLPQDRLLHQGPLAFHALLGWRRAGPGDRHPRPAAGRDGRGGPEAPLRGADGKGGGEEL